MIETLVTPTLAALFQPDEPGAIRLFAVLDGGGPILTDDPAQPTWAIVRDLYGTLFFGGAVKAEMITAAIAHFKPRGDVLVGLWPHDRRLSLLPAQRDYDGWTIDFDHRAGDLDAFSVPAGCELRRIDAGLFPRCTAYDWYVEIYGANALSRLLGFALLRDGELVSEAFAMPPVRGVRELGVDTAADHRRLGYATIVAAAVIRACEFVGFDTYWNCAAQNVASAALARRLGYRRERRYRLLAWLSDERRM